MSFGDSKEEKSEGLVLHLDGDGQRLNKSVTIDLGVEIVR